MIGTVIGNYQVLKMIGHGGMGSVYEAVQNPIGRRVAIKILHPEYANDSEVLKRFFNEARAANLVNHPSIVQVSDYGQLPNGSAYLVMEYLSGQTLAERLDGSGGRLSVDVAQHIAWQLASALSAAHAASIIHRDLKPSNIMLVPDAIMPGGIRVKILDFGIAKLGERGGSRPDTRTGSVLGTPAYMAPEQCIGAEHIDGKADVYALGIILFEVLCGEPPFSAPNDLALLNMQVSDDPPSLQQRAPHVPTVLSSLIRKMLRKKPAERPAMVEVLTGLQRLGASQSLEHLVVPSKSGDGAPNAVGSNDKRRTPRGTLPSGFGQQHPASRTKWRVLTAAVSLLLVSMVAYLAIRPATKSMSTLAPGAMDAGIAGESVAGGSSNRKRTQLVDAGLVDAASVDAASVDAAAPGCMIDLETTPSGVQVIDAEGETVIGTTPWSSQLPTDGSDLWLLLRKPGFHDRVLRLKPKAGVNIQRHEVLVPMLDERKRSRGSSKRQSLKIEDVKKRFFSNPDGGAQVDIPESYRIVD